MSAAAAGGSPPRPRILCVDDEPAILEGMRDGLRRGFDVRVADNGPDALALLKADPARYAVVISDMRMPGMSGAVVLREARRIAPLAPRILLTGHADTGAAIQAVNEGQIFRFLLKPCPSDQLQHVCAAAVGHHRLLTAERMVFEHAQYDTIETLAELFAACTPDGVANASERSGAVLALAWEARIGEAREPELAAKLLGLALTAPPDSTATRLPQVAAVLELVRSSRRRFDSVDADGPLPVGARILRIVADHTDARDRGTDARTALASLREHDGVYDPDLLDAFERTLHA